MTTHNNKDKPFVKNTVIFLNTLPNCNDNADGITCFEGIKKEQLITQYHTVKIYGNFSNETAQIMYNILNDVNEVYIYTRSIPNDVGVFVKNTN